MLANEAGGKQAPGILGVSLNYVLPEKFLKGDGGMPRVVWVDSELRPKIEGRFLPGPKVATEKDVGTLADLKAFLSA